MRAGEVLCIPPNMPHEAWAEEDTIDLDVFDPPREDWLNKPTTISVTDVSLLWRFSRVLERRPAQLFSRFWARLNRRQRASVLFNGQSVDDLRGISASRSMRSGSRCSSQKCSRSATACSTSARCESGSCGYGNTQSATKVAFEQSLGHAGFLRHRPQQFLGLLHLGLALGKAIGWLCDGCHILASSGNGISRSIWPSAFPWASVRSVRRRAPRIIKFNAPRLGNSNRSTDSMPMGVMRKLPRMAAIVPSRAAAAKTGPILDHMRLLLVEDDRMIGESLQRRCAWKATPSTGCATPPPPTRTLASERFDLVLLDLGLPRGAAERAGRRPGRAARAARAPRRDAGDRADRARRARRPRRRARCRRRRLPRQAVRARRAERAHPRRAAPPRRPRRAGAGARRRHARSGARARCTRTARRCCSRRASSRCSRR